MKKLLLAVTAMGALAAGGAAIAGATGGADGAESDQQPSTQDAAHATDVALAHTGAVKANSVELDGENGATYEVEVARSDGSTADVRLDDQFKVVVVESDSGE